MITPQAKAAIASKNSEFIGSKETLLGQYSRYEYLYNQTASGGGTFKRLLNQVASQRITQINTQLENLYSGYDKQISNQSTRQARGEGVYSNITNTLGLENRPLGITATGKSILGG